jgi:hypothetical protein
LRHRIARWLFHRTAAALDARTEGNAILAQKFRNPI